MAQAKKKFNDEPPLDKKTIRKGHEIADKLMSKKEENVEEGRMSQIDQMRKDGASAADIAKELKLPVKIVKDILGEDKQEHPAKALYESLEALKKKAEKTGMPYSILKQVYDRGMAAWKGGHRPGAGQHQWALARVNSFVTKSSGTWGGADKDLAAKVKGSK
jgi:regulator of replication initiation timing